MSIHAKIWLKLTWLEVLFENTHPVVKIMKNHTSITKKRIEICRKKECFEICVGRTTNIAHNRIKQKMREEESNEIHII